MKTLLLTGFGAFPGAPNNPTQSIVEALASRELAGATLVTRILPVIWRDADVRMASLIHDTKPDAILHLGLSTQRKIISVETRARNECTRLLPDADNICRASGTIDPQGPGLRHARLDSASVVDLFTARGLKAALSDDAGDYICNHTLYLSLGSNVPHVGFIHLPMPDGAMSLQAMTDGVADVVQKMARGF